MLILIGALALIRRDESHRAGLIPLLAGVVCLALAAGNPLFRHAVDPVIAVMIDLSPSTRGATFRDPVPLNRRIGQLVGNRAYQLLGFSDHNQPIDSSTPLKDLPCEETRFTPPPVDAVILFSDGRFDMPASAPATYPVIDPALDEPADAAVTHLQMLGDRVQATISHSNEPIHWSGATPDPVSLSASKTIQSATASGTGEITASVSSNDLWPENDSLSIVPPPPLVRERWWVGENCPADWTAKPQFPSDPQAYLSAGIIVLSNMPANALSDDQQLRLVQYVRDLGGSLVIVGGDHAFAAGGYGGSELENLSPLSSNPPKPTMHWLIVSDSSGSMAGDAWNTEAAVIRNLLPKLPTNDLVSVGDFARDLHWWWHDVSASTLVKSEWPTITPTGPTNLSAMLNQLASEANASAPSTLLLMTDADAELPDPAAIADAFTKQKIALNLLAIGRGSALQSLRAIAKSTGGTVVEQLDPGQWISSANQLLRTALPPRYQHTPADLIPGPGRVTEWNQTWAKADAQVVQRAGDSPMVARWRAGLGEVLAIAYPADPGAIARQAVQIAQPPADPRFDVKWDAGAELHVSISAADHGQNLNGQTLTIELRDAGSSALTTQAPIPQTGPGQYAVALPGPRTSQLVVIRNGEQVLRQFAVAGRYAREFDTVGNDLPNLSALAKQTGGYVIPPGPTPMLNLPGHVSLIDLTSLFAIAGFLGIGTGLVLNRKG